MARFSWIFQCLRALFAAGLLLAVPRARAQNMPPRTVEDALHRMSDEAGVIFAGQVIAVHRQSGGAEASGVVEVEFRVDQAVRGCTAGAPYVLREWAGLWAGGVQRYRVGERLLMFLRTPSASGLSSPVDGMDGAVPIHGGSSPLVADSSTVQYPVADLRWVGTQVLHPVSYRTGPPHPDHRSGTPIPFLPAHPMVRAATAGAENVDIAALPMAVSDEKSAAIPAQQTPVPTVIGLLKSWQKVSDAAR